MNKTKKCISCNIQKARNSFYLRNKNGQWISAQCKKCTNISRKKRLEKQLGRKLGKGSIPYTIKEIDKLKTLYLSGISYEVLEKQFPARTRHALETKLSELGIASRKNYMLKRQTGIEALIEKLLIKTKVVNQPQAAIGRMHVDFLLDNNLVLEVLGSYWHSDPILYPNGPKYKLQQQIALHDNAREKRLLSLGYNILYIWEYDIEHNFEDLQKALNVVLDSNIWDNNRPISVELLRDNTEINNLISKGKLSS